MKPITLEDEHVEMLVAVTDKISEALAVAQGYKGPDAMSAREHLLEINREVWRLRGELGIERLKWERSDGEPAEAVDEGGAS